MNASRLLRCHRQGARRSLLATVWPPTRRACLRCWTVLKLDAIVYPVDGRGGAQATCHRISPATSPAVPGVPAVAFPVALDSRGLPIGLELLGRSLNADETLVAMMGCVRGAARGAFPDAALRLPPVADMAGLRPCSYINNIHREIGYRTFRSRKGEAQGDLAPDRFRALTDDVIRNWRR